MLKKTIFLILALVLIFSSFVGCGTAQPAQTTAPATTTAPTTTAAVITLQYTSSETANINTQANSAEPMIQKIEKLSNGRVKVIRNFGGTLANATQELEAVRNGVADFARALYFTENALFNILALGTLPFAGKKDPWNAHQAVTKMVRKYGQAELKGLHFFSSTGTDPYTLMLKSQKPMTVAELKGIKVRNPGGYGGQALEKLGMAPVSLTLAEVYDALSKNTIEAAYAARNTHKDYKFYEICKYQLCLDIGIYSTVTLIMNDNTWNKLPPDIQKIFADVMDEWAKLNYQVQYNLAKPAEAFVAEKGVTNYYFSDAENEKAKQIVTPVWDKAVTDMTGRGLNGKAIMTDFVTELKALGETPPWAP